MNVVVDTNVWIDFFDGHDPFDIATPLKQGLVHTTSVIVSEIVSGAPSKKEEAVILEFFGALPLVTSPLEHWINVGRLRHKCRAHGFTLSTPDAHIAQSTLDINGVIVTKAKIFTKISALVGLTIMEPTSKTQ